MGGPSRKTKLLTEEHDLDELFVAHIPDAEQALRGKTVCALVYGNLLHPFRIELFDRNASNVTPIAVSYPLERPRPETPHWAWEKEKARRRATARYGCVIHYRHGDRNRIACGKHQTINNTWKPKKVTCKTCLHHMAQWGMKEGIYNYNRAPGYRAESVLHPGRRGWKKNKPPEPARVETGTRTAIPKMKIRKADRFPEINVISGIEEDSMVRAFRRIDELYSSDEERGDLT